MRAGVLVMGGLLAVVGGAVGMRAQDGPPPAAPLRETFVSAGQVVIDDAMAIDMKAADDHFAGPMQQLKQAIDNLGQMAQDDREKEIAGEMKDMMFQISSCHIQAIDGTPTATCEAQVKTAETRAMELLKRHKDGGRWVEGEPAE